MLNFILSWVENCSHWLNKYEEGVGGQNEIPDKDKVGVFCVQGQRWPVEQLVSHYIYTIIFEVSKRC